MSKSGYFCCLLLVAFLQACVGSTRYHHFLPLSSAGWRRQDSLVFRLPDNMRGGLLEMEANLRVTRSFPYTKLWIGLEQRDSSQHVLHVDTLCINMVDGSGNLLGRGQDLLEYTSTSLPLQSDTLGLCREVYVYHLMSRETIPAVTDLGLHVFCK